jgi:Raf kinase inhibitor-like YbhB/YbcL family protein
VTFTLTSTSFVGGTPIPERHTCDGKDVSPPLSWSGTPGGAQTFALIDDDPDARKPGGWVHWVIYNIPASVTSLPEGLSKSPRLSTPDGAIQGTNDFGKVGFNGSCPPPGAPHHYHFTLYALDSRLSLEPGATRDDVRKAMTRHILGQAELVGIYARPR